MKNIFYILFAVFFLSACGPHRMRCGARGIYKSPEKQTLEKSEKMPSIRA